MELRDVFEQLRAIFPATEVKVKPQAIKGDRALALPHLDARQVIERLDQTVGPDNWADSYHVIPGANVAVICRLTVLGIPKEGIGEAKAGSGSGDELYKAAESDALKRAGVKFGIGRYLYALPKRWLAYDGRRFTEPYTYPPGLEVQPIPKPTNGKNGHSQAASARSACIEDFEPFENS